MRLSIALRALVLALVAAVYAPALQAAAVDVAAVASGVSDQLMAISLVGAAVLLLFGAIGALRYVKQVMGVGSVSNSVVLSPSSSVSSVRGYGSAQEYLDSLASRLAAEDAANGVEWRDVDGGKSNLDYEAEFRAELEAAGSDPVLYEKYRLDDSTHEEALRWSNKESNAEIKMPAPGAGWDTGEIKMPVLGPGWK